MKKEKSDLEQLLNSLIEKGWKPFGNEFTRVYVLRDRINKWDFALHFEYEQNGTTRTTFRGRRPLVSKESGLWQFCCENGMIKEEHKHERILDPTFGEGWADCKRQEHDGNYGYRLIESALCDEDKLEEFLLNSIKLD